jgi:hypothetical protein
MVVIFLLASTHKTIINFLLAREKRKITYTIY